jgi:hypothetical protein
MKEEYSGELRNGLIALAAGIGLEILIFGGMTLSQMETRQQEARNPPVVFREDINKDGLEDVVVGGYSQFPDHQTQIWYNRGNNVYSRDGEK